MKAIAPRLVSKFVSTYDKLFDGYTPEQISPHESAEQFWSNLLSLEINQPQLGRKFREVSKDEFLTRLKPYVNTLINVCLRHLSSTGRGSDDTKREHAAQTLSVTVRCVLEKSLSGWEAMEILAGGVSQSDEIFLNLVGIFERMLVDKSASIELRHQVLQLAVVFTCSIKQLSPGAYLLRRDLFPAILTIVKSPETEQLTFEASLFLSLLANFHRSDAAKLNPYLQAIKETEDRDFIRALVRSTNYAMDTVIKAYQEISDDSPPTFATSMTNLLASWRPDRALSPKPVDTPKELFKDQPVEAAVILMPVHDFIHFNTVFTAVLLEPFIAALQNSSDDAHFTGGKGTPLVHTLLTLASYLFTHASSTHSPRATSYAGLCLTTLLRLAENDVVMSAFVQAPQAGTISGVVRLCRQRQPWLPPASNSRPTLCAFLDCCVLWLRHNLHKRFEGRSYLICTWILHRIIWFLSRTKRRLEYHWEELWRSLIALLDFLAIKLVRSQKIDELVHMTIQLLHFAYSYADSYLGSPKDVHQLVYELARSTLIIGKQEPFFQSSSSRRDRMDTLASPADSFRHLTDVASHYEKKLSEVSSGAASALTVLRAIAKDIDRDGLYKAKEFNEDEAPRHSDESSEANFVRIAYADGLALMPGPDS